MVKHKLTFNEIFILKYYKTLGTVVINTIANDPIVYTLNNDGTYHENKYTFDETKNKNSLKPRYPDWSKADFTNEYEIYNNADIKDILHDLETKNLWTTKTGHIFTYIDKRVLKNTSHTSKNNVSKNTRKRSVHNKNGRLLPRGWHRISENGKNRFEGPKNERYNNLSHYANSKNSRVKPQTYKRTEDGDTWYVLPDGSISWEPYYR